jgi:predicted transposase YbfD/YdcC
MCRHSAMPRGCTLLVPVWEEEVSLLGRLRGLPDPRDQRGLRHPLWAVILVAASAVVAGADSYAAIAQWAARAPQHTLRRLGRRLVAGLGIPDKTNEIGCFTDLLAPLDLEGVVVTVDELDEVNFPHAHQVARVTRHSTCVKTSKRTRETVYVITSLTSAQATPQRLALIVRRHWGIEALHHIRDVTFG